MSGINDDKEALLAKLFALMRYQHDPAFFFYSGATSQEEVQAAVNGNLVTDLSLDLLPTRGSAEAQEDQGTCISLLLNYARHRKAMRSLEIENSTIEPIRQCLRTLQANPCIRKVCLERV
jgi:hypothetical protein